MSRGRAFDFVSSRWARAAVGFLVVAFCAAPVPGDAGGCNQRAVELDPTAFFTQKQSIDCQRCSECNIESASCSNACARSLVAGTFTDGCVPLVHDGEVCLRALLDADCDAYVAYTADRAATTPTECNFCPRRAQ